MKFHITTAKRNGRRINDRVGTRTTWCGAPVTEWDVTPRDARKIVRTGWGKVSDRCEACFHRLLELDFKKSERVED